MAHAISIIWNKLPKDIILHLENCINNPGDSILPVRERLVFFRADDIAVPSENFSRLLSLFSRYRIPLSLAVVPAWLTDQRWKQIKILSNDFSSLWCWHQHGWRHANHAINGKKYEFGQSRSITQIRNDLKNGMNRLKTIMGEHFYPIFTPPWNRCDLNTLNQLKNLGFKAVSRSLESKLIITEQISEYNVNVDLHTRKETDPGRGWDNLLGELNRALKNRLCGIMIHHQLMNEHAFDFIEYLFQILKNQSGLKIVHLGEVVDHDISG